MEKVLFADKPEQERRQLLEDNADFIEQMDYMTQLNDEEIELRKSEFAQKSIEEARLEDEKKEIVDEYKEKLGPIKKEKSRLLDEIKHGAVAEYGKVYKFVEIDTSMVGYYNDRGQLVSSRPANQEERSQLTITHSIRKAN